MTPVRWVVLLGAGLVGLVTATVSAVSLYQLAVACAFHPWLAPGLPVAVDVAGTVGAVVWVAERARRVRVFGQAMAVTALVLTLAGNALAHAIAARLVTPGLALVLSVGAVVPLSLYATVHLCAILLAKSHKPATKAVARAVAEPAKVIAPDQGASEKLDQRVAFWLHGHRAQHGALSVTEEHDAAVAHFGRCSEMTVRRARKILREANPTQEATTP